MRLTPVCRWCGAGPLAPTLSFTTPTKVLDFGYGPFHLHACQACGTWQLNPHPGPKASRRFFSGPERWFMGVDPDGKHVKPIELLEGQREEYSEYAKTITALLPENGAIMDVGAATGLMLSLIDDPRAKVAVEPNAFPATVAMREGHMVIQDWAEALSPPPKPLACIIMNKTLDHLPRPDQFLAKAVNWLAPGGLLLLGGLINPSCLTARIYGPDFRLFHPFHQVYPTPAAVDKVLTPYGLELVTTWRPYFQTPHGSPVKFLKTCGFIALRCLKLSPVSISKAFPGNTVTYLYRKRILFRPLKVETPVTSSLSA